MTSTSKPSPTVIITGASTGIGQALALRFAREGYDVGLIARRQPLLEDLKKQILIQSPACRVFVAACDVNDEAGIRKSIHELTNALGHLNVFIANAGIGQNTPAWKENRNTVLSILQTNVLGAVSSLEVAKEIMLKQGDGHLVGISSVAGFRGLPEASAYCASKAALTTYLEGLRVDLHRLGLPVTSIHPGYVATPMTEKNKNMPFLMEAEEAVDLIFKAIRRKKSRLIFPRPMKAGVWFLRHLPDFIYDRAMRFYYRKGVSGNEGPFGN